MNGDFLQDDEDKEARGCDGPPWARAMLVIAVIIATFCGVLSRWWMEAHP